jgi:hypothetical protein
VKKIYWTVSFCALENLNREHIYHMNTLKKHIIGIASVALVLPLVVPSMAHAAEPLISSTSVCSIGTSKDYACMEVNPKKVPSGDTATFTGTLSTKAQKNLKSWTNGDHIACLTRYPTHLAADGSTVTTTLDAACTTVRKDGGFTINAEFGRKGTFNYGLEMGPCRSKSPGRCGSGDPGLIGLGNNGNKVLQLKTT